MGDDNIEFVYNTRLRRENLDVDFQSRLASAFLLDIRRDNIDDDDRDSHDVDDTEEDFVLEYDASDAEEDFVIEPNGLSDSDSDDDDDDDDEGAQREVDQNFFYGKDGTQWSKEPPAGSRIRQHNIMQFRSGPRHQTSVPIEVFKLFFSPNIMFIIISETNRHAKAAFEKWNSENPTKTKKVWKDFTSAELDAFIGIVLAAGASHNNMQELDVLWKADALPIFRAAMSSKRFKQLRQFIRFDDSRTREFRQRTDKAAPIRDIWNFLNENLAKNFDPYETIAIDEQLFPYRGRTKFTQYIPSKPAKYGIKIWWACDSKTNYPLQGMLYTGKLDGQERKKIKVKTCC